MKVIHSSDKEKASKTMAVYGKLEEMDRTFDYFYWQQFSPEERAQAAWELARDYHQQIEGIPQNELRLQRTIESFQRLPG